MPAVGSVQAGSTNNVIPEKLLAYPVKGSSTALMNDPGLVRLNSPFEGNCLAIRM